MLKFKTLFEDKQRNFYFLLALVLVTILFTHPFLRYPYDMFTHLIVIDKYHEITESPKGNELWHYLWAKLFYLFSIANNEIFFRAQVIHIIQTYIAFFSVFFFSKVVIRNIFKEIDKTILNYLSLWSVIIWFSIFATFSVLYQQVWNMWYSVNYQITLPLFWYITALTLVIFLEKISTKKKILFILQILLISRFILQVHSMEFLYYLMYLLVFGILYLDRVYYFFKKYFYVVIPSILIIIYFITKYQTRSSRLFNYLETYQFSLLYHDMIVQGKHLVHGGLNRASASINELMVFICYLSIILVIFIVIRYRLLNKTQFINIKPFLFIILTSMFAFIPLYEASSGLFALLTYTTVVNRLYYSSSLFVLLPIFMYYILYLKYHKNISIAKINLSFLLILSSIWIYSKYYTPNQTYYKNVKSIKNSFFERRVGFHLSPAQVKLIGKKISIYEKKYKNDKIIHYYARGDIAFVIKYIYRKSVLWRRGGQWNPDYIKIYNNKTVKQTKTHYLVLFETPKGFPEYKPFH